MHVTAAGHCAFDVASSYATYKAIADTTSATIAITMPTHVGKTNATRPAINKPIPILVLLSPMNLELTVRSTFDKVTHATRVRVDNRVARATPSTITWVRVFD
jgi:hypothetical protein